MDKICVGWITDKTPELKGFQSDRVTILYRDYNYVGGKLIIGFARWTKILREPHWEIEGVSNYGIEGYATPIKILGWLPMPEDQDLDFIKEVEGWPLVGPTQP